MINLYTPSTIIIDRFYALGQTIGHIISSHSQYHVGIKIGHVMLFVALNPIIAIAVGYTIWSLVKPNFAFVWAPNFDQNSPKFWQKFELLYRQILNYCTQQLRPKYPRLDIAFLIGKTLTIIVPKKIIFLYFNFTNLLKSRSVKVFIFSYLHPNLFVHFFGF